MTFLVDTNVLVYAVDPEHESKRKRAEDVLAFIGSAGRGVLSAQVLAEFANVVFRRAGSKAVMEEAGRQVEAYDHAFVVLPLTRAIVLEAARGVRMHRFSYYDAQIWAAARLNQIPIVLSEDFNSGATIEGVTFIDPFSSDFEIDELSA